MRQQNQELTHVKHEFDPIFDENSEILILGTLPSVKSREQNFYYGHPQNRFWKVIAALFEEPVPGKIPEKKDLLLKHHIALWDVIAECDIAGSSDSSIKNVVPAELSVILDHAPIRTIYANGAKAYDLQHTITGWPGGKPNADDTYRPERAKPFPKRVVVFSPHPDDDVISMGGTLRRLVQQGHEVHVAYETSGNIAVGDEEVVRFMHFINGFNQLFDENKNETIKNKYAEIKKFLLSKKEGDMDTRDILTIKGLIRRGEARTASTYNQIPLERVHFLDLPFYETGRIEKNPISEADVNIVMNLLREVKPHQIYVAGDLADPHGTHRVCTDAVLAAIDEEKKAGAEWLKDCRIWMYRGAWAEWEIENIEMAVPLSPEELRAKRNSILKHQSQMESAPFLGNDERLFWQRSEDRNRGTASLYDSLGLACYEAMEAFVEYKPL